VFQLEEAISVFSSKGHRILIFGRQHMKSWEVYERHNSNATSWFFTQNALVLSVFVFVPCKIITV